LEERQRWAAGHGRAGHGRVEEPGDCLFTSTWCRVSTVCHTEKIGNVATSNVSRVASWPSERPFLEKISKSNLVIFVFSRNGLSLAQH
jgi:hypothetical protein